MVKLYGFPIMLFLLVLVYVVMTVRCFIFVFIGNNIYFTIGWACGSSILLPIIYETYRAYVSFLKKERSK